MTRKYSAEELMTKNRWDKIHKEWKHMSEVDESMPEIAALFQEHNVKRVLDLGCGSGRHTIYLAQKGFDVYGIDISEQGIKKAKETMQNIGLSATLTTGSIFGELPYNDNFFDSIISIRVLHHGRIENIRKAIKEIERVVTPNGFVFVTVKKRTARKKMLPFKEIAPRTYIKLEGVEKDVVHYLFNKKLLIYEFRTFKICDLWVDSSNYYCLLGKLKE
jgi:2-polyprenyl-3-methyl-5-hydroxy-6-metoxy-1,4-benzoquinol methylase